MSKCECQKIDVTFENVDEFVRVGFCDKSENLKVDMAPVGNVLINERTEVLRGTTKYWDNQRDLISRKNVFYLYTDYRSEKDPNTGAIVYYPGLKIGDGLAYLIDLPFVAGGSGIDITQDMVNLWNSKWRGYIPAGGSETLVFTTN